MRTSNPEREIIDWRSSKQRVPNSSAGKSAVEAWGTVFCKKLSDCGRTMCSSCNKARQNKGYAVETNELEIAPEDKPNDPHFFCRWYLTQLLQQWNYFSLHLTVDGNVWIIDENRSCEDLEQSIYSIFIALRATVRRNAPTMKPEKHESICCRVKDANWSKLACIGFVNWSTNVWKRETEFCSGRRTCFSSLFGLYRPTIQEWGEEHCQSCLCSF